MTALAETQAWWQETLLAPERPSPAALGQRLVGSSALPASEGFAIYRRAFLARIKGAMREQFPALCHALGPALFDDFIADYVRCHPPRSHTLHDLGARFVDFLAAQRPDVADAPEAWIDFMIDLARFERQLFQMHDRPGAEQSGLAGADVPDHRLRLQPAIVLDRYRFNVAAYQQAERHGLPLPEPQRCQSPITFVRRDYIVRILALADWEATLLGHMIKGLSFADAAMRLPGADRAGAGEHLTNLRDRWIVCGMFVEVE